MRICLRIKRNGDETIGRIYFGLYGTPDSVLGVLGDLELGDLLLEDLLVAAPWNNLLSGQVQPGQRQHRSPARVVERRSRVFGIQCGDRFHLLARCRLRIGRHVRDTIVGAGVPRVQIDYLAFRPAAIFSA